MDDDSILCIAEARRRTWTRTSVSSLTSLLDSLQVHFALFGHEPCWICMMEMHQGKFELAIVGSAVISGIFTGGLWTDRCKPLESFDVDTWILVPIQVQVTFKSPCLATSS